MYTMEEVNGTWRCAFTCAQALFDYCDTMMQVAGGAVKWGDDGDIKRYVTAAGKEYIIRWWDVRA